MHAVGVLSIAEARRLLGTTSTALSDSELESLIQQLHAAGLVIGGLYRAPGRRDASLGTLAPEQEEAFEERAAILEFEAKLSRNRAERLALVATIGSGHLPCVPSSTVGSRRASRRRT